MATILTVLLVLSLTIGHSDATQTMCQFNSVATSCFTVAGRKTVLRCGTTNDQPVDFGFQVHPEAKIKEIVNGGQIVNGLGVRFGVQQGGKNEYQLIVFSATINDTGIYRCTELSGIGATHFLRLNVTEADYTTAKLVAETRITDIGASVTLPCHSTRPDGVDWAFNERLRICQNGAIVDGLASKYSLATVVKGDYSLVIRGVLLSDAGTYTCTEDAGVGPRHTVQLIVLSKQSSNQVAMSGRTVTFACRLNNTRSLIRWSYNKPGSSVSSIVFNGRTVVGNSERIQVHTNMSRYAASVLVIIGVNTNDAGQYECYPHTSATIKQTFELTVLNSEPTCEVDPGYEVHTRQELEVRCSVDYTGNLLPGLRCYPGSRNATLTRTSSGSTVSARIVSMCDIDGAPVTCSIVFSSVKSSAGVEDSDYSFRWKSSEQLRVTGNCGSDDAAAVSTTLDTKWIALICTGLVVSIVTLCLLVVVGIVIITSKKGCRATIQKWRQRGRRNGAEIENRSMLNYPQNADVNKNAVFPHRAKSPSYLQFSTHETEPGNQVRGVCVIGDHLYVARLLLSTIEIYNSHTMDKFGDTLDMFNDSPCCMAACPNNRCLYVTFYRAMTVQKLAVVDKSSKTWNTDSEPDGVSVTPSSTVVVVLRMTNDLVEFDSEGGQLHKIRLPVTSPRHAVRWTENTYVVCYGVDDEPEMPRGMQLINKSGKTLKEIDSKTEHPLHLALEPKRGYLLVADFNSNRVTGLDRDLNYMCGVIEAEDELVDVPFRVCFDEKCERLYVGEFGGRRRVVAFDIKAHRATRAN